MAQDYEWDDLLKDDEPKPVQKKVVKEKEEKPKVERPKVERPKVEKPKKDDDAEEKLKTRIRELEQSQQQQNKEILRLRQELTGKNERIRELESLSGQSDITANDKRNFQFLVNCVAKTYKNEFRKSRAPAVHLALTNIIEKIGLDTPDEM